MLPVFFKQATVDLGMFEVQHITEPEQWATIEALETRDQCVLRSERLTESE